MKGQPSDSSNFCSLSAISPDRRWSSIGHMIQSFVLARPDDDAYLMMPLHKSSIRERSCTVWCPQLYASHEFCAVWRLGRSHRHTSSQDFHRCGSSSCHSSPRSRCGAMSQVAPCCMQHRLRNDFPLTYFCHWVVKVASVRAGKKSYFTCDFSPGGKVRT